MLWMVLGGIIACILALAYVSNLMKQNRYGQPEQLSGASSPAPNTTAEPETTNVNPSLDRP
ncbi:hypothetical protein [Brevibacillus sp. NRS-1366]|uniref:hypothetical protein n=1 Tax=Brevibacillus sp. NRS-1366 TaxID=3233899 RepID=UPI003D1B1B17